MPRSSAGQHAEFRQGRSSLEDEPRSGRPSEAVCEENCRAVENTVLQNRRVNMQLIADAVGISTGSVKTILREHLLMRKVSARWVPRMPDQTRKLCYRKDDRAMRPTYGCPENFRDSLTTPRVFPTFSWAFVPIHPMNVPSKFEVRSFTHS